MKNENPYFRPKLIYNAYHRNMQSAAEYLTLPITIYCGSTQKPSYVEGFIIGRARHEWDK